MNTIQTITPFLWFDDEAETAVRFYTAIFNNSKILNVNYYGEAGYEHHGKVAGTVMTVAFELEGQPFTALNGGPIFKFNESISFQVNCESQANVDYYWEKLSEGGNDSAQQCGWLKDKFGLSWQIIPRTLADMLNDSDAKKSQRVMQAMLSMKKLNIKTLTQAYKGLSQ